MTIPFMYNFRSSIFHISLPELGYFSWIRNPKIFEFKNVMKEGI